MPSEESARPRRVLLVDDNADVRYLTRLTIESPWCEIVGEAHNGAEALEMAEALRPDIVLMDMHMPIMDGVETTRILKHRFPEMEVIIVSGSDDPESHRQMLEAGTSSSVEKGQLEELIIRLDPEPGGELRTS